MIKDTKITCPNCGYEYLPNEIFYPESVFGDAKTIIRTPEGKIDIYTGKSFDLTEDFVCENCDCHFLVEGKVAFVTKAIDEHFDEEYVSELPEKENKVTVTKTELF